MSDPWKPKWDEKKTRWTVEFWINDQRYRRRLRVRGKGSLKLAEIEANKLYTSLWKDTLIPQAYENPEPYFVIAAAEYLKAGKEARFLTRIVKAIKESKTIPNDIRLDQIDSEFFTILENSLYPKAKQDTVHRQLIVPVRAVINHARREWPEVKRENTRRARWLTPEEAERLLVAANDEEVVGSWDPQRRTLQKIAFMLGTGAGPGEMLAVDARNLNTNSSEVWISEAKTQFRPRWAYVAPRVWGLMGDLPSEGTAFLAPNGKPYVQRENGGGQMKGAFDTVREAAGLGPDVTPYVLRHTWATWFASQNSFDLLMKRGGWGKAETANQYTKLYPSDLSGRLLAHGWDFRGNPGKEYVFGEKVGV